MFNSSHRLRSSVRSSISWRRREIDTLMRRVTSPRKSCSTWRKSRSEKCQSSTIRRKLLRLRRNSNSNRICTKQYEVTETSTARIWSKLRWEKIEVSTTTAKDYPLPPTTPLSESYMYQPLNHHASQMYLIIHASRTHLSSLSRVCSCCFQCKN